MWLNDSRNATCLLCQKPVPPAHVAVYRQGAVVAAICASHSLQEVILARPDAEGFRFFVTVERVHDSIDEAAERVDDLLAYAPRRRSERLQGGTSMPETPSDPSDTTTIILPRGTGLPQR